LWRTDFDPSRRDELQYFADVTSAAMFRQLPGCLGYVYAVSGATWITQTFWAAESDIAAAEASSLYRRVVGEIVAAGFLGDRQETEVFEVTTYAAPPR
jgi:hypothetical protein